MGMRKKVEDTKVEFLLLCKQYNRLAEFRSAEIHALQHGDQKGLEHASKGFAYQFHEIGETLKRLGANVDRLGGPPVLTKPPQDPRRN